MRNFSRTQDVNIKAVIFDFDNTLYEGDVWERWTPYLQGLIRACVDNEKEFYAQYPNADHMNGFEVANILLKEYGSAKALYNYQWNNRFELDTRNIIVMDNDSLLRLKSKYQLFIVSNSAGNYVEHYLQEFNIDKDNFVEVMDNLYDSDDLTKAKRYREIMTKYNLSPQEILVVGDNYKTDIEPAIALNIHGKWIKYLNDVKSIINKLMTKDYSFLQQSDEGRL